jgi:hypothetical protein
VPIAEFDYCPAAISATHRTIAKTRLGNPMFRSCPHKPGIEW